MFIKKVRKGIRVQAKMHRTPARDGQASYYELLSYHPSDLLYLRPNWSEKMADAWLEHHEKEIEAEMDERLIPVLDKILESLLRKSESKVKTGEQEGAEDESN